MTEQIRTFIAVELPSQLRRPLAQIQEQLKRERHPVRWVTPDKIHLTLKFLGEIAAEQVAAVGESCARVAAHFQPFQLEAIGVGCFPHIHRPRNVWIGLQGDLEILSRLQTEVEAALAELGFPPENRKFSPHLTLGRVRRQARPHEARRLGQAVAALAAPSLGRWTVEHFIVMRSDLRPDGPVYTPQHTFKL
ncbi:MAG: RNA 2',3'-cyclic phosphodiesterase [Chloroflexia bacterium]|nr:RNA 2',3'-cyclic phosphodiesterase [Chloroflexia bacterium]